MTAKAAKGHTSKHAGTNKHAGTTKHHPTKAQKAAAQRWAHAGAAARHAHAVARHAKGAKATAARGLAIGDALPVCTFEALAMSLRLAGQFVHDDEVAGLWSLTGAPALGASLAATLDAADLYGLAGFRPRFERLTRVEGSGVHAQQHVPLPRRQQEAGSFSQVNDLLSGDFHALILGVDRPGPHAVLATPDGWWSWGELWSPWTTAVSEAWAVAWS